MTTRVRLPGGAEGDTEVRKVSLPLLAVTVAYLLPYTNIGPLSAPSQVHRNQLEIPSMANET